MALASAAAVMILSVGGSLGFVPGAQAGPPTRQHSADHESRPATPDGVEPAARQARDESTSRVKSVDTPDEEAALPADSGHGRRIVYDIGEQRVWLVGPAGRVLRTYEVSGSRFDNLKPATYRVTSMSRHAVSFDHRETMNYMVRFASGERAPIGFHDVPAFPDGTLAQSRDQLGTPLSAGCIRQWITDARVLWDFAEVGTTVVVLD
jgi:lipoprotein-anchoring transpeptidase ErfK/SrfK